MTTSNIDANTTIQKVTASPIDYYPTKQHFNLIEQLMSQSGTLVKRRRSILPGFIARSDGFNVDDVVSKLKTAIENAQSPKERVQREALLSRLTSISDLTPSLYEEFKDNPVSIKYWYPKLQEALKLTQTFFKTPETTILELPIELAQFIRLEYQHTNKRDRDLFNQFIFDTLKLTDEQTYFIKTGSFSSKFQFANAKCSEPREMGEYFQVINNHAMMVGAAHTVDVCVREYIDDPEGNPTIYNGMPLRTEFRAFIDFDSRTVLGTVPYWHPVVMKRALKLKLSDSMEQDYHTYIAHQDKLNDEFNDHVAQLNNELDKLAKTMNISGTWSVDVMKSGSDFYIIDMAPGESSALIELLPDYLARHQA